MPELEPLPKEKMTKRASELRIGRQFRINPFLHDLSAISWSIDLRKYMDVYESLHYFIDVQFVLCEHQLKNISLLQRLRSENFDIGISEVVNFCGYTLFDRIGIKTVISAFSTSLLETSANHFGYESNPSYVPSSFSRNFEAIHFKGRLTNVLYHLNTILAIASSGLRNIQVFISTHARVDEVISKSSYVFVNSNEFFDFPRPLSSRVVYTGGTNLGAPPKELDQRFNTILNKSSKYVVLISFGSIVNCTRMPANLRESFFRAFHAFREVEFLWKYEEEDDFAKNLTNVHKLKWIPQYDLLRNSKLALFITHGGINSIMESIYAGIPMLCIPLFGEQYRNARAIERYGAAYILDKLKIDANTITEALSILLANKSYVHSAMKLSRMIRQKSKLMQYQILQYTKLADRARNSRITRSNWRITFIKYYYLDLAMCISVILLLLYFC